MDDFEGYLEARIDKQDYKLTVEEELKNVLAAYVRISQKEVIAMDDFEKFLCDKIDKLYSTTPSEKWQSTYQLEVHPLREILEKYQEFSKNKAL